MPILHAFVSICIFWPSRSKTEGRMKTYSSMSHSLTTMKWMRYIVWYRNSLTYLQYVHCTCMFQALLMVHLGKLLENFNNCIQFRQITNILGIFIYFLYLYLWISVLFGFTIPFHVQMNLHNILVRFSCRISFTRPQ